MTGEERQFRYAGDGERLDKFLVAEVPEHSRNRLQNLIKDGQAQVNGNIVSKAGYMLQAGDEIRLNLPAPEPSALTPEKIPLEIVFENNDVIIVNKAAGMVVHPAAGHDTGTLVHAALAHAPLIEGVGGEQRPGVVHRLDKDTSGLILLAKNDRTHRFLQDQFRDREVEKVYLALVDGAPPTPSGRVEAAIGRDTSQRKRMAVVPDQKGRSAVTEYFTLETFDEHSLIEAHPHTGRTHQIRLHLSFLGCPIVGDTVYGRRKPTLPIKRHFLHAARLTIQLPGEKAPRSFEAPLPSDLQMVLDRLRAR
jgi:23S rRNA pseudouridine1911/1915/1917 synthase